MISEFLKSTIKKCEKEIKRLDGLNDFIIRMPCSQEWMDKEFAERDKDKEKIISIKEFLEKLQEV